MSDRRTARQAGIVALTHIANGEIYSTSARVAAAQALLHAPGDLADE